MPKVSLGSDPEDVLVERNAMTRIIMQTLGRHRRKNLQKRQSGSSLPGCTDALHKDETRGAVNKALIAKRENLRAFLVGAEVLVVTCTGTAG